MIDDAYSPYKIVHHFDKLERLKKGQQTVPIQIQFVPSNTCNQRCSFCAYRMKKAVNNQMFREQEMLSYEKSVECLDDFAAMGVKGVHFTGGGEPLVHPDIRDMFNDTLSRGLDLALVSNGVALNEELCNLLGRAVWVRISIDSATAETYSQIRGVKPNVFFKVIENVKNLVKCRRDQGCVIGIGYVVNANNYHEIFQGAKLAKELGVDNVRISGAFTPGGYQYFDGFRDKAREMAAQAEEELSDSNFKVFNLFNDRMKDLFESKQAPHFCSVKELITFVGADYNVYTCCTLAYNSAGLIGSIKEQSFRELWKSQKKVDFFNSHDPKKICTYPCLNKGKIAFINYCIKKSPKHINFI
ncbi:MAG: radical SAM protein [Candidatus Thorarchaeota archaeon]